MKKNIMKFAVIAMASMVLVGCVAKTDDPVVEKPPVETPDKVEVTDELTLENIHGSIKNHLGADYVPISKESQYYLEMELKEVAQDVEEIIAENNFGSITEANQEEVMKDVQAGIVRPEFAPDKFIAIKGSEGTGPKIEKELQAFLDREIAYDGQVYIGHQDAVEAGKVVRHGDYVFLVMLGGTKESVQGVVDVIDAYFE